MTVVERWVDSGRYRLLLRDSGSGPPALLLHGLGCHTSMWAPLERSWTDIRLVSFDPPGVGRSPGRMPPPSITGIAGLALDLLDELGLAEVDVLGYSLGGTVAQALARMAPDRVRRLVLVATAPGWGAVPGSWFSWVHLFSPLRYFSRGYYKRAIGAMAGGQARNDPQFVARHAVERFADRPGLVGYYGQLTAASLWSSLGWLHEIAAPTLVVAGGDDPLLPPVNGILLARRIRRARLLIFPEDGHLLLFDDRSEALPALREFLSAPTLDVSATWSEAREVSEANEEAALRASPPGLFPWGVASAAYRRAHSFSVEGGA